MNSRMKAVWWRPQDAEVDHDVQALSAIGVTDVLVWAEPFVDRLEEWRQLRRKVQGRAISFHTWITVNHHYGSSFIERLRSHPDWIAVGYDGVPSSVKPLAGTQVWACPANPERWRAEWNIWEPLVLGSDGLNLDYIRYPDGFRFGETPEVGRVEVPEQSFCYCERCQSRFRQDAGIDPRTIAIDQRNPAFLTWQSWRQDQIVDQVKWYRSVLEKDGPHRICLSADVFPTPSIARNNVQQDWARFGPVLDFVCPMVYAKAFWGQPSSWIADAVEEGQRELAGSARLIAGIGPHSVYSPKELQEALWAARFGGSDGETVFCHPMTADYLKSMAAAWH